MASIGLRHAPAYFFGRKLYVGPVLREVIGPGSEGPVHADVCTLEGMTVFILFPRLIFLAWSLNPFRPL